MIPRRFDREDIDLLSVEEIHQLLPYGRHAIRFGRFMAACVLVAGIVAGISFFYRHVPQIWVPAAAAAVGALVVGIIGEEVKFRRFRRLTAEAINKHKNGTP